MRWKKAWKMFHQAFQALSILQKSFLLKSAYKKWFKKRCTNEYFNAETANRPWKSHVKFLPSQKWEKVPNSRSKGSTAVQAAERLSTREFAEPLRQTAAPYDLWRPRQPPMKKGVPHHSKSSLSNFRKFQTWKLPGASGSAGLQSYPCSTRTVYSPKKEK